VRVRKLPAWEGEGKSLEEKTPRYLNSVKGVASMQLKTSRLLDAMRGKDREWSDLEDRNWGRQKSALGREGPLNRNRRLTLRKKPRMCRNNVAQALLAKQEVVGRRGRGTRSELKILGSVQQ